MNRFDHAIYLATQIDKARVKIPITIMLTGDFLRTDLQHISAK